MTAPTWMTDGASEVRKQQIERDWQARLRIPKLRPIATKVLDNTDPEQFPNISAACEWVRSRRSANDG